MPSLAATADAATKIAAVSEGFAETEVFWEMQGFDKPTIARIMAQKRAVRNEMANNAAITAMFGGEVNADTA
jgi:hypothetical protein